MGSMLLWILKAAGIFLGVVSLFVLLLLFLVLFVPICYQVGGKKYDDEIQGQAIISYLNPIVRIYVQYPEEQMVRVKICGITIFPKKEKKQEKEKQEVDVPQERQKENVQSCKVQTEKDLNEYVQQQTLHDSSECVQTEKWNDTEKIASDAKTKFHGQEEAMKKASSQHKKGSNKASLLWENRTSALEMLQIVLKAMKTLLPKYCRADIAFGTGEPDVTGYVYAVYCSLSAYLPKGISYEPIWTERILEGEIWMKGRLRLIYFVMAAVRIFINKDIRLLIKKIRSV